MGKTRYAITLAATSLLLVTDTAFASTVTMSIPMKDISAKSGERGSYYVVSIQPPAEIIDKRLDSVFIEFVVDVTPTNSANELMSYKVGVFPLMEPFTGATLAYETEVSSVRVVQAGEDRKVLIDITDIVREWVANPATNHGLVIGALTGPTVGSLALNDDVLSPSAALRVTFFYQNRFGGRVPTN